MKPFPFGIERTIFLKVYLDFVGLRACGSGPSLTRLLLCPGSDVTPVETSIRQLDAPEAKPKLSWAGLRQNQTVSEWAERTYFLKTILMSSKGLDLQLQQAILAAIARKVCTSGWGLWLPRAA